MSIDLNSVVIRSFCRDDQDVAKQLIYDGLSDNFGKRVYNATLNPDLEDIASAYHNAHFFVACFKDKLIGTGAFIHETEGVARIVRMSVIRSLRRSGIGIKILNFLIEHAKSLGYKQIVTETTDSWKYVIEFYQRYGSEINAVVNEEVHFSYNLIGPRYSY